MTPTTPVAAAPTTIVDIDTHGGDHRARLVSWGAIFAGTLIGVGLMILLSLFGLGLGFAVADPAEPGSNVMGISIGAAIWFVLSQLVSLFAGGYAASRLSANLGSQKAMLHGASVWALTTVAAVYLAVSGAGTIVNTGFSALEQAGTSVASAAQAVIPDDASLPSFGAPDIAMSDLPAPVQNALREQGVTANNLKAEAREAFRAVVSKREQAAARSVSTDTARDIVSSPSDAISDIEAGIDDLFGKGGVLSAEDRTQFATQVEQRFGITKDEAETFVTRLETRAKTAADDAKAAIADAREQTVQIAQSATEALSTAAFWAGIASLLGLGAAVGGAATGRRDKPVENDYA